MDTVTVAVTLLESGPRVTLSGLPAKQASPEEWEKLVAMVRGMVPGIAFDTLAGPLVGAKEAVYVGTPVLPAFRFSLEG